MRLCVFCLAMVVTAAPILKAQNNEDQVAVLDSTGAVSRVADGSVNANSQNNNYGINSQNPLSSGIAAVINVLGGEIQRYAQELSDENSSPVLDTIYTAISGVTKELSVAALTFRNLLDPTDWGSVHAIGRMLTPIVDSVTRSANSVAENLAQHGLQGNDESTGSNSDNGSDAEDSSTATGPTTDRINGLETYIDSLRDVVKVAQTYDIDSSALSSAISRLESVLQPYVQAPNDSTQ